MGYKLTREGDQSTIFTKEFMCDKISDITTALNTGEIVWDEIPTFSIFMSMSDGKMYVKTDAYPTPQEYGNYSVV